MAVGVRVTGLNRVVRGLQQVGLDVTDIKSAFAEVAAFGARAVKRHTPVGPTGNLRRDVRGNRAKNKAVVTAGRKRLPYAGPINYGWPRRNIKAAGFMQKGDKDVQPFAARKLENYINTSIRRSGL